jgi:hypothetical protein
MMKPRDAGTIPLGRFEHLENTRFLPSRIIRSRPGEVEMISYDMGLVDGIFDCGDNGAMPSPPIPQPGTLPAPGGAVAGVPVAGVVEFTSTHGIYNAYIAVGTSNKVTAITDADNATRLKPASQSTNRAHNQLFHFTPAPAVADDDVIKELSLHIIPHQTLAEDKVTFISKAILKGVFTQGGWRSRGKEGSTAGVEFTLDIPRPGGGQWFGRDLKDVTCAFGVRIGYSGATVPEIRKMWFTYSVGA